MATDTDSAASGGLLVILGIVVAGIAGYFFFLHNGGVGRNTTDINIRAEVPAPSAPTTTQ